MEMLTRFQTKRLKIFENQSKLLEELRMYHRKEGKIVPMNDDVISALRYAVMSLRKARVRNTEPIQLQSDSEFNLFKQEKHYAGSLWKNEKKWNEKKENDEEEKMNKATMKSVISALKKASKAHAAQAVKLEKMMKAKK